MPRFRSFRSRLRAGGLLFACLTLGCAPRLASPPPSPSSVPVADTLASGVIHRAFPASGIDVVEVDLTRSAARCAIVADGIGRGADGRVVGTARTPEEWREKTRALACVNGGYFGTTESDGRREIVGLLVQNGRVRHAAPPMHGRGGNGLAGGEYARSALGLTAQGVPQIAWVSSAPGSPQHLRTHAGPMAAAGGPWRVNEAVGCGPTLIQAGKINVCDRRERLVSPGPLARTFVAYDGPPGRPQHLVVGIASAMTYDALAAWLAAYFPKYDGTTARAAMCLDGGASTQMTYRRNGALRAPRDTLVAVATAVVLLSR